MAVESSQHPVTKHQSLPLPDRASTRTRAEKRKQGSWIWKYETRMENACFSKHKKKRIITPPSFHGRTQQPSFMKCNLSLTTTICPSKQTPPAMNDHRPLASLPIPTTSTSPQSPPKPPTTTPEAPSPPSAAPPDSSPSPVHRFARTHGTPYQPD